MILRALTNGKVSGVHTLIVPSQIVGGVLITTNNTDAASVTVRRIDANGLPIIDISTVTSMFVGAPFGMDDTDRIHVTVSGTGASAQIYEWVP